ncbi:basigin-like [Trichosurus vulpecula]|uniref:basigin-like n=1 Tax=Trichosurus vulpecula TaxID=9337 RepID=UPI00186AEF50|nr:basigin-like [Trichosurus vulpecula]
MGFALLGRQLLAALLSVLVFAFWEVRSAAAWKTGAECEPQPLLTCTLNQTEEDARFEGHLPHTSGRPWLRGDRQLQKAGLGSPASEALAPTEDQNGDDQCVFPGKGTGRKTSRREKERPEVFANPKTKQALEGEDVVLVCESHSCPSIDCWDWYRHHDVEGDVLLLNGTGQRVFITESAHRSELLLRRLVASEDPGQYICVGTNSEGYYAAVVLLKVRRQLAALWPFLGIVLELLVLFAIILLSERSRSRADELPEV